MCKTSPRTCRTTPCSWVQFRTGLRCVRLLPEHVETTHAWVDSGKKSFLAGNSLWRGGGDRVENMYFRRKSDSELAREYLFQWKNRKVWAWFMIAGLSKGGSSRRSSPLRPWHPPLNRTGPVSWPASHHQNYQEEHPEPRRRQRGGGILRCWDCCQAEWWSPGRADREELQAVHCQL